MQDPSAARPTTTAPGNGSNDAAFQHLAEGQRLLAERMAILSEQLATISEDVRDLATIQRDTLHRVEYLEDFLQAVRREVYGNPVLRAARRLFGGPGQNPVNESARHNAWTDDFVRVYPDGRCYDDKGHSRPYTDFDRKNYLNHVKFYRFAAQFAAGRSVLDVGCGTGYGTAMLADAGARRVCGCDLSDHALDYARREFGGKAEFIKASCTDMRTCADSSFDLIVCSEVLEHLTEAGQVDAALSEMKRVSGPEALFVLATPNVEMIPGHGFAHGDLHRLCDAHFSRFVVFENALVPLEDRSRSQWILRKLCGDMGLTVTQNINLAETALPPGVNPDGNGALLKRGLPPGTVTVGRHRVDTRLLHNTHSFVAVATGAKKRTPPPP